jgi:hypothetical protein
VRGGRPRPAPPPAGATVISASSLGGGPARVPRAQDADGWIQQLRRDRHIPDDDRQEVGLTLAPEALFDRGGSSSRGYGVARYSAEMNGMTNLAAEPP